MSQEKYCNLIDALCGKLGVPDPEKKYDDCNLEINGVTFTLMHGGDNRPDVLTLYADYGEAPSHLKEIVYRRLLETAHAMQGFNAPSFAFNSETGHVIQMAHLLSSDWKVDPLITTMGNMTKYAQMWRRDFFLTEEERGVTAAGAAPSGVSGYQQ